MAGKNTVRDVARTGQDVAKFVALSVPIVTSLLALLPKKEVIPDVCPKGYRHTLSQAKDILERAGFNVMTTEMSVSEAAPRFKDYSPFLVVGTFPKANSRVNKGASVTIKYITQDVIDASQLIFEEEEKLKHEKKPRKIRKQLP